MYVIDLQLSPWHWITYWGLRPREKRLCLSLVLYLLCCVKMWCRSWQVEIRFCLRLHVTCGNSECDLFSHLAHHPTQRCFVALIHSTVFLQLRTLKASSRAFFFLEHNIGDVLHHTAHTRSLDIEYKWWFHFKWRRLRLVDHKMILHWENTALIEIKLSAYDRNENDWRIRISDSEEGHRKAPTFSFCLCSQKPVRHQTEETSGFISGSKTPRRLSKSEKD